MNEPAPAVLRLPSGLANGDSVAWRTQEQTVTAQARPAWPARGAHS